MFAPLPNNVTPIVKLSNWMTAIHSTQLQQLSEMGRDWYNTSILFYIKNNPSVEAEDQSFSFFGTRVHT